MNQREGNITLKKGQEFTITLKSNPTSGYGWIPTFNKYIIDLTAHEFQPTSPRFIGNSGKDIFTFKAISYGSAILKMFYRRSWEEQFVAEKIFFIDVE
jgi:inhibitor of cysteine peptidase